MSFSRGCRTVVVVLACVAGCGGSTSSSGAPPGPAEIPIDNGQTGSIGSSECTTDDTCREKVAAALEPLAMPSPSMPILTGTSCEEVGLILDTGAFQGPACHCAFTDGPGEVMVGPHGDYCSSMGRGRDCLYSALDFSGCEVGSPTSCEATCADVRARLVADNARTFTTEVREARCEGGGCIKVLRVENRCFIEESLTKSYDCNLSNEEIHRQASTPVPVPQCDPAGMSGGGTCVSPGAPQFFPRDPNEWQGMLVDISVKPYCEMSDRCGLALACVDNACGPCTADAQCAQGEGCVLDHCVRLELIGCRHRVECPADAFCILSGLTGGTPRGNEDMRAYCQSASGGTPMRQQ